MLATVFDGTKKYNDNTAIRTHVIYLKPSARQAWNEFYTTSFSGAQLLLLCASVFFSSSFPLLWSSSCLDINFIAAPNFFPARSATWCFSSYSLAFL
mmetsp:Transcript_22294/g.41568  ORF Transcript_22294/g.41568 Transcript_22294/m.41568 type:complete len:97 (+) Transcript_22294:277-567(+)